MPLETPLDFTSKTQPRVLRRCSLLQDIRLKNSQIVKDVEEWIANQRIKVGLQLISFRL